MRRPVEYVPTHGSRTEKLCRWFWKRAIIAAVLDITKTARGIGFILLILLGFTIIALLVASDPAGAPNAPRFVPGPPPLADSNQWRLATYSKYALVQYQNGKLWVGAVNGTNFHVFLYDLDRNRIVGELFNTFEVFANHDQTKLLYIGRYSFSTTAKWRLAEALKRISKGKIDWKVSRRENICILDLRNNRAKTVGSLFQLPGTGSTWVPAPGLRHGYNTPTTSLGHENLFICDLKTDVMWRMKSGGAIQGWWDDHTLLIQDQGKNLVLLNVITRSNTIAVPAEAIKTFLRRSGLPDGLANFQAMPEWNGSNYTFYFQARTNWVAGDSYLLKLNQASSAFEVVQRKFDFQWQGMFDVTATHYLFDGESGEPGRGGNGGVYLRDLESNTTRTLIEPDNRGEYAISRFYRDRVIYCRDRQIWSINLDGSNNFRVFPPGRDVN